MTHFNHPSVEPEDDTRDNIKINKRPENEQELLSTLADEKLRYSRCPTKPADTRRYWIKYVIDVNQLHFQNV